MEQNTGTVIVDDELPPVDRDDTVAIPAINYAQLEEALNAIEPLPIGGRDGTTEDGIDDISSRHWRESPFAVGLTQPTWEDDNVGCCNLLSACCSGSSMACLNCSGFVCGRCAGRVGNMIILYQTMEDVVDETGRKTGERRPRLRWVLGPYWPAMAFITVPMLLGYALLVATSLKLWKIGDAYWFALWLVINVAVATSLFLVACSDPGIRYRYARQMAEDWRYSDQALTYRPPHAKFDPDCAVVIDHFDHTCFWTGTGIGGRNIIWFRLFLLSVTISLFYNTALLVYVIPE